ncbi:MAG: HesA/MoeB/ThiF family protein [Firmicutes bacterium]|nr:HesA/MoeB/ThiF family protein [Bacillota bacterium]
MMHEQKDRYQRNGIVSYEEQLLMKQKKVCVIGCGGLGGYIIEMLTRFGIGTMTVVDGDVFDATNLNRQLLSTLNTLGKSKAFTAAERVENIDSSLTVQVVATVLDRENASDILKGHDVVVDALDSNSARLILLDACRDLDIPLVHGAIGGWFGQVSTVFPEDEFIRSRVRGMANKGIEKQIGNPSFTPACIASIQVAEVVKVLLGRGELLREKIMFIDLLNNEIEILDK